MDISEVIPVVLVLLLSYVTMYNYNKAVRKNVKHLIHAIEIIVMQGAFVGRNVVYIKTQNHKQDLVLCQTCWKKILSDRS